MESQDQETNRRASPRRMLWAMVYFWSVYTACLALALFGSWQSRWLKPDTSLLGCGLPGIYLETSVLNAPRVSKKSWVMQLGVTLAYLIPPVAILQYRELDRLPEVVRTLPPWNPVYSLAFGMAVYVILMIRIIWICRNRQRGVEGT